MLKTIVQAVLLLLSAFFVYKIYDSINSPIRFNKVKNSRYAEVIKRLKTIRVAQIAHKDVKGFYADNFDSLVSFIDNGIFTLTQQRDSSYLEYDRIYRVDVLREVIITDTLGFVAVKDSLFKNNLSYKEMATVPVPGVDETFDIKAKIVNKNGFKVPVFEVKVSKNVILHDQDKELLEQENKIVSVDAVDGNEIVLGSLTQVSTSGNWPTIFDAN